MINNNLNFETFKYIITFINNSNTSLGPPLSIELSQEETYKKDSDMFYNCGQLLSMFYLFNIKAISEDALSYFEGKFYITNISSTTTYVANTKTDCISISKNIIDNSTYLKDFIPTNVLSITNEDILDNKNILDIETGFKNYYILLLEHKLSLIKDLKNHSDFNLLNVINNLSLLNYNDLNRQIKLLRLKLNYQKGETLINNVDLTSLQASLQACNEACIIADRLIETSIIGISNNQIEITWIGYLSEEIAPIGVNNIYISFFFAYLSKETNKKYYLQPAIQALTAVINNFKVYILDNNNKYYDDFIYILFKLNSLITSDYIKCFIQSNDSLYANFNGIYNTFEDNYILESKLLHKTSNLIQKIIY